MHIFNYSPSVAIAQLYTYIFKKKFDVESVCEMCINIASSNDRLFAIRTQGILNRYLAFGNRIANIVDNLCVRDTFMFPLAIQRRKNIDDPNLINVFGGACRNFPSFYIAHYKSADMLQTISEYVATISSKNLLDYIDCEFNGV